MKVNKLIFCLILLTLISFLSVFQYIHINKPFEEYEVIKKKVTLNENINLTTGTLKFHNYKWKKDKKNPNINILEVETNFQRNNKKFDKANSDIDSNFYLLLKGNIVTQSSLNENKKDISPTIEYFKHHKKYEGKIRFSLPSEWTSKDCAEKLIYLDQTSMKKYEYYLTVDNNNCKK